MSQGWRPSICLLVIARAFPLVGFADLRLRGAACQFDRKLLTPQLDVILYPSINSFICPIIGPCLLLVTCFGSALPLTIKPHTPSLLFFSKYRAGFFSGALSHEIVPKKF